MNLVFYLFLHLTDWVLASHNKAYCTDTSNWVDKHTFNCWFYERKGICSNGEIVSSAAYYGGNSYNFPELNCCECGKS